MKVLVTGGSGFIGSHLVEALCKKGYRVLCMVRKTSNLRWIKDLPVDFVQGDLLDKDSMRGIAKDLDYVYHLAGVTKAIDYRVYERVNYIGTRNILEVIGEENNKIKRFIYLSSLAAVGPSRDGRPVNEETSPEPVSRYGISKRKGEEIAIAYMKRFPVTIIRPPAIYGPRDRDLLQVFKIIKKGIIPVIDGDRYIDLCHVKDLVQGIMLAGESEAARNDIFFISSGKSYSWSYIGRVSASIMGVGAKEVRIPLGLLYTVGLLSHLWAKITNNPMIINMDKIKEIRERYWICDINKAEKALGYKPEIPLEDGIKETINWYGKNGWI